MYILKYILYLTGTYMKYRLADISSLPMYNNITYIN